MKASGRGAAGIAIAVLFTATPSRLPGQLSAAIDGGFASIRYDDYLRSGVATLTPSLRADFPLSILAARGTVSFFESGSRSVDVNLGASTFTHAFGAFRAELNAVAGATAYSGFQSEHVTGNVRLHMLGSDKGAWLGGGHGWVDDGLLGANISRYAAGAWLRSGSLVLRSSANHVRAAGIVVTDYETGVGAAWRSLEVSAGAGLRTGGTELIGARLWGDVTGVFSVGNSLSLLATHGRSPADPARGTPGSRFTAFSVRLATGSPVNAPAAVRPARYEVTPIEKPVVSAFSVRTRSDSVRTMEIRAPGARRVEISGDFTDWTEADMQRVGASDRFRIQLNIPAGSYKFNVRVDAGEWGVPPGVPVLRDDFGAAVALLLLTSR